MSRSCPFSFLFFPAIPYSFQKGEDIKIIEARLNFIAPRFNAVLQGKGGSPLPYFLPFGAQIVEARLNFIAPRFNAVLHKKGVEGD